MIQLYKIGYLIMGISVDNNIIQERKRYRIKIIYSAVVLLFFLLNIVSIIFWKIQAKEKSFTEIVQATTLFVVMVFCEIQIIASHYYRENIKKILDTIETKYVTFKDTSTMIKIIKHFNYYDLCCVSGLIAYPFFTSERMFAFPAWTCVDNFTSVWYKIILCCQMFLFAYLYTFYCTIGTFLWYVIGKSCSEIKINQEIFTRLGSVDKERSRISQIKSTEEKWKNDIKTFIEQHKIIRSVMKEMTNYSEFLLLCQFLGTVIIICFFAVGSLKAEYNLTTLTSIFPPLFSCYGFIFMTCWYGEQLTKHFDSLYKSVYYNTWYNCPKPVKSSLLIISEYLRRPVVLKGGYVFEACLDTFPATLKATISYILILRTLTKDKYKSNI